MQGKHEGKPRLSHALCLLLEDAGKLTTDPVRSGHVAAALLSDPGLSPADMAKVFAALPRVPLHLLASRFEDRGEVGRVLVPVAEVAKAVEPAPAEQAPEPAPAEQAPDAPVRTPRHPANAGALRSLFADRLLSEDASGITVTAHVQGRDTTLRIEWDAEARTIVLRIMVPGAPPADAVRTAVALSTLNNAIPYGTFVMEGAKVAFRSHVFLDADSNAPLEIVAFAARTCEEAAEALT
jgi:hypothetical protein